MKTISTIAKTLLETKTYQYNIENYIAINSLINPKDETLVKLP